MKVKEIIETMVQSQREVMLAAEKYIGENAESGFREVKTSKYMADRFNELGYQVELAGNIPGFTAELDTGRLGCTLAIFAELDSLIVPEHPQADVDTGAAHACGHHTECAAILGVAAALNQPEVLQELSGKVRFVIVPAEELIEIEFRDNLRKKGEIKYFSGKVEFLYRGLLDGIDLAYMVHSSSNCPGGFAINKGNNGCITKSLTYRGKSAHAGSTPHLGINALYAANIGMQGVNALRETFKEHDFIRVHPIITSGGDAVNAIPSVVKVESFVRASNVEAMMEENRKVNRAFAAGAVALGAGLNINDRFGYMPLRNDTKMAEVATRNMIEIVGEELVKLDAAWSTGSTDMGDLSTLLPIIHPYVGGAEGTPHGSDYLIKDADTAIVKNALFQAYLAYDLLKDGAKLANEVVANKQVLFRNKAEYFDCVDSYAMEKEVVKYEKDGDIVIQLS